MLQLQVQRRPPLRRGSPGWDVTTVLRYLCEQWPEDGPSAADARQMITERFGQAAATGRAHGKPLVHKLWVVSGCIVFIAAIILIGR